MGNFTTLISPHVFEKPLLENTQYLGQLNITLVTIAKYSDIIVTHNLKISYREFINALLQMPQCPARKGIITFFETRLLGKPPRPSANVDPRQSPHQGCADLDHLELIHVSPPVVILNVKNDCNKYENASTVTPEDFGNSEVYLRFLQSDSLDELESRICSIVGESVWNSLHPLSRELLIAGQHDYEARRDRPSMPFNPVINSFANALEKELLQIISGWKHDSVHKFQINNEANMNTKLLHEYLENNHEPTLGNFPYLFDSSALSENPILISWKDYLSRQRNSEYLMSGDFINKLKSANNYRRKADHPKVKLTKKDCDTFLRLLLGDSRSPGLLARIVKEGVICST